MILSASGYLNPARLFEGIFSVQVSCFFIYFVAEVLVGTFDDDGTFRKVSLLIYVRAYVVEILRELTNNFDLECGLFRREDVTQTLH